MPEIASKSQLFSGKSFIHHVSLNVKDLPKSVELFRDRLGLKLLREPETYPNRLVAWFEFENGQQLHLIQSLPGCEADDIDTSRNHVAISVPDIDLAREVIAGLDTPTVNLLGNSTFVGQAFMLDFDGNIIEACQLQERPT